MKVYLAAPWTTRHVAHHLAQQIRDVGHEITSHWHDDWLDQDTTDPATLCQEAQTDFADVIRSEVVVVWNSEKSEGKAVEQGIAICFEIPVIVVGVARTNVFQYLASFTLVPTIEEAIAEIGRLDL